LPLYYYLTDTANPTRYDYFQPGMHTAAQSDELLAQLESRPPRAVLFENAFAEKISSSWPGTPLTAIAADPVADYILRRYHACRVLTSAANWKFLYLVHEGVACP